MANEVDVSMVRQELIDEYSQLTPGKPVVMMVDGTVLTPEQAIQHLKGGTSIGQKLIDSEIKRRQFERQRFM